MSIYRILNIKWHEAVILVLTVVSTIAAIISTYHTVPTEDRGLVAAGKNVQNPVVREIVFEGFNEKFIKELSEETVFGESSNNCGYDRLYLSLSDIKTNAKNRFFITNIEGQVVISDLDDQNHTPEKIRISGFGEAVDKNVSISSAFSDIRADIRRVFQKLRIRCS